MTKTKRYTFDDGNVVQITELQADKLKAILIAGERCQLDAAGYGATVLEAIADLNQALVKAAEDER